MKKLLVIFAILALAQRAGSQATNPQKTFWGAEWANHPSLALNFNDATTSFKDQVSQTSFGPSAPATIGAIPASLTANVPAQQVSVMGASLQAGTLTSISLKFQTAPSAVPITVAIFSGTLPSLTIVNSFTITPAATTTLQTFVGGGVNFPTTAVTAGEYIGTWATTVTPGFGTSTPNCFFIGSQSTLPSGAKTYTSCGTTTGLALTATVQVVSQGTITLQQPGFDNTNPANYSAAFPYNAWSAAPNNTMGAIDWTSPWSLLIHVNQLNWDHVGVLTLASKGDIQGCTSSGSCAVAGSWWRLFLQPYSSTAGTSQLCFERNGTGATRAQQLVCTSNFDGMPNGFNYDIVIEDAGAGRSGSLSMYLNGVSVLQFTGNNTFANGFGNVAFGVTSGGTGYAAITNFTSTGGGANCVVTGTANATSGVITSLSSNTGQSNSGCTSNPTIVLTSPTGTGAVLTATAVAMSMNSTTAPVIVGGYVSNGVYYGAGGTDTSQNPLYVDEFAIFPSALSFGQVTNLFYTTKFYQGLLYPGLTAKPPLVIFGGYGCGPDFSGDQTVAMTIGAAKAGLIHLIGMIDDDGNLNGSNGLGWWRQMLDQAGLNDVPLSVGTGSPSYSNGGCPAATITASNASTPQNAASYESSITMLRTLFAKYSTQPIYALITQTANSYGQFLASAADSISPLTGLQLQAQNATNGGYINLYQGNLSLTPTYYTTIYNDNGTMPIYIFGGAPQAGGPGILASRTSNDPLYLAASNMSGGDTILGYTQLNLAQVLTPYFYGGVTVTYSSGTGYANSTPFTSTGGGTYCHVTGIMTASGGVPNGIETSWGTSFPASTTYSGLGYGCTSAPTLVLTSPTGTGVTLTATTTLIPTCYGTSGCVDQYVVWPNQWSQQVGGTWTAPIFTMFQNSLMDPPANGAPRLY
jgi:hypothetical protein